VLEVEVGHLGDAQPEVDEDREDRPVGAAQTPPRRDS
jgi:hypothetical protein